jgi:23S rRNA pseudouridine2605 synthase
MELIKNACPERVYPVGRLDRNTTGLLLLTNDGELTKKLTHPSYNKKKLYHVEVDQPISKDHIERIAEGIELEDGLIIVDAISYVDNLKTEVGIELHSGRNRIVRRIMEHFGYNVKRLDRVYFAGLSKLNLPRGRWRFLTDQEVIRLKTGMYE